jgi:nucleoside-diphosphate-sugar epimerase
MKILITGGAGFLGKRLVARLLARADIDEIVLVDVAPAEGLADPRVRTGRRHRGRSSDGEPR